MSQLENERKPNKIILARSSVPGREPVADKMAFGEIFINYADGFIFYKDSENQVRKFESSSNIKEYVKSNFSNIPLVHGTNKSASSVWTGVAENIDQLKDGTTILYWISCDSPDENITLDLTLNGGFNSGAQKCYWGKGFLLNGLKYPRESVVCLTYRINPISSTEPSGTGWYVVSHYTDTNTEYEAIPSSTIRNLF